MFQNVTHDVTDRMQLEFSGNWNYLMDEGNQGVATVRNANNRAALLVPAEHPANTQARPFIPDESCGEVFSGNDPFRNASMIGTFRCSSGNPNLNPEPSTITNIGFTWKPLNDLSINLDYQEVEYVDRIRTLSDTDTVFAQFDQFLRETGRTRASYNATPGSADRQAAEAWLRQIANRSGNPVVRHPNTMPRPVSCHRCQP